MQVSGPWGTLERQHLVLGFSPLASFLFLFWETKHLMLTLMFCTKAVNAIDLQLVSCISCLLVHGVFLWFPGNMDCWKLEVFRLLILWKYCIFSTLSNLTTKFKEIVIFIACFINFAIIPQKPVRGSHGLALPTNDGWKFLGLDVHLYIFVRRCRIALILWKILIVWILFPSSTGSGALQSAKQRSVPCPDLMHCWIC